MPEDVKFVIRQSHRAHNEPLLTPPKMNLPPETVQTMFNNQFKILIPIDIGEREFGVGRQFEQPPIIRKVVRWCNENCSDVYVFNEETGILYFACEEDATGFKLQWS